LHLEQRSKHLLVERRGQLVACVEPKVRFFQAQGFELDTCPRLARDQLRRSHVDRARGATGQQAIDPSVGDVGDADRQRTERANAESLAGEPFDHRQDALRLRRLDRDELQPVARAARLDLIPVEP
jgi:hypothetical protein